MSRSATAPRQTGRSAPLVSVVTPFHDRRPLLPALLATLARQTLRDFELVIVDDGSSDGLAQAVAEADAPFPLRCVRLPENRGAAMARNAGIDAALGRYVALLDSDDSWHPEKLQRQMNHLESGPPDLVSLTRQRVTGGASYVTPAHLMTREDDVGSYLFQRGGVIQSSMMVLARRLAAEVRFEDGSRGHDDWSFALRLQRHGARFEMLPEPLTLYDDGGGRPRRSPAYSSARLAWLAQRRSELGEAAYWAAVAAVASHLHGDGTGPLKLIATALRNGAIGPARAAYYTMAWACPPLRSLARGTRQTWSAATDPGPRP